MIGKKLDPNKYEVVEPQNLVGQKFDTSRFEVLPQKSVNVFNDESKKVFNAPNNMDEDELRYNYQKQVDKKEESNFWGMTDISSVSGQIIRGTAAWLISVPSLLGSAYRASVEAQIESLEEYARKKPKELTKYERVSIGLLTGNIYTAAMSKDIYSPKVLKEATIENKDISAELIKMRDKTQKIINETNLSKQAGDGWIYDYTQGGMSFLTAMVGSYLTRNPAFVPAFFGAMAKGGAYDEMKAKGYSSRYSNQVTWKHGVRQGLLEMMGVKLFGNAVKSSKPIARNLTTSISRAIKKVFKSKIVSAGVGEGIEEGLQGIDEEFTLQKFGGRQKGKLQTMKDISYQALMGFAIGAPSAAIVSLAQKQAEQGDIPKKLATEIVNEVKDSNAVQQVQKLIENETSTLTQNENKIVESLNKTFDTLSEEVKESKKGIKEQVKTEIMESGVDEAEADQVSDIIQARAEASGAALGISPQEWLESKRLQIRGESPDMSLSEGIQEETMIEDIDKPTEVLFQKDTRQEFQSRVIAMQDLQDEVKSVNRKISTNVGDGTVTLYHGTSKEKAKIIKKEGLREQSFLSLTTQETKEHIKQFKDKDTETIEIKVDPRSVEFSTGTQEFYAPNGLVFNPKTNMWQSPDILQQTAVDQTKTPAFKKWFEDSKVVDKKGEPIVVYHGTSKEFTEFKTEKTADTLFWFTKDKGKIERGEAGASQKGDIMPVYLSIKKPATFKEYDKFTIDELIQQGYDGLILEDDYIAFSPTQIKSATANIGAFDPTDPNILRQKARGQIEFGPDSTIIRLFQGKDKSTLLHETGHLFLRDMQAVAEQSQDPQAKDDMQILRDFYKVKEGEKFSRENEEKFADDFVGYIGTGKAPNAKLVGAFERFKQWLLSMYDKVKGKVELTPEVQEVFDRMLGGYDVETATNIKEEYGDRVTELRNLTENIKAGKLADITQSQLDDMESLINAAKQRPPAEPQSLLQWIKRRGGIWDKGGELTDMDLPAGVIRKQATSSMTGQAFYNSLDSVRESAIEEGFLEDVADINVLLDAIAKESKGDKLYRKEDLERLSEREKILQDKENAEIILSQLDISPEDMLQIIRKERSKALKSVPTPEFAQVMSRIERLERAIGRIATDQKRLTDAQIKAITKADIKEIHNRIIDLIKTAKLKPKDQTKFIETIKNIQTGEQLAKILPSLQERIARYKEQTEKGRIREQIEKELKTIKPLKVAGKRVGKFTAQIQKQLDALKAISKLTVAEAKNMLNERQEDYTDSILPNEAELLENKLLLIKSERKATTLTTHKQVLEGVLNVIADGKALAEGRKIERKTRREKLISSALTGIQGSKPLDLTKPIKAKNVPIEILRGLLQGNESWSGLMNWIGQHYKGKTSDFEKWAIDTVDAAEEAKKAGVNKQLPEIEKMAIETLGLANELEIYPKFTEDDKKVDFGVWKHANGRDIRIYVSKAEIRKLWQLWQDPTLKRTILPTIEDIDNKVYGSNYTEAILNNLFGTLTSADFSYAQTQMNFYKSYYNLVNELYQELYGIALPYNDYYTPLARDISRIGAEDLLQEIRYRASAINGSLKERKANKNPIKLYSDNDVLQRHVVKMEHFRAWATPMSDLNSVFGDREVRDVISGKFGKSMMEVIDKRIINFANGGRNDVERHDKLMQLAKNNFTTAVLGGKTISQFSKQFTSYFAFWEDVPTAEFAKLSTDFLDPNDIKRKVKILFESDYIKDRWREGMTIEISEVINSDKYAAFRKKPTLKNYMMLGTKYGDIAPIMMGGWAVYQHNRNQGKTHKEALHIFSMAAKYAQQSSDLSQLSSYQQSNAFVRSLFWFATSQRQYWSKEMKAIRDFRADRISNKNFAKKIFIYHFLLPQLFQFVASFGWDKEKQLRAAILGSWNGVFILKDLAEWSLTALVGLIPGYEKERIWDISMPIFSTLADFSKELGQLDVWGIMDAVGEIAGYPVKTTRQIIKGIGEIPEKPIKGTGMALGWTEKTMENALKDIE
ncbi:MAG TPA: hypothetical protein VMW66_02260 [Elusimicrobiales bacterium]|nr:hypothetical protein [Elusimicrobiales bacterium]